MFNIDGSVLTNLVGYRLYYGSVVGGTSTIDINNSAATSFTFSPPVGRYVVSLTALASDGSESQRSNRVQKNVVSD